MGIQRKCRLTSKIQHIDYIVEQTPMVCLNQWCTGCVLVEILNGNFSSGACKRN